MLWYVKLFWISSGLWICRSHSILWKLDFCQLCNLTAGCNFNNQLLFTAFCLTSVCWIKTNGVIYIPIVFCPLTVHSSIGSSVSFSPCLFLRCVSSYVHLSPLLDTAPKGHCPVEHRCGLQAALALLRLPTHPQLRGSEYDLVRGFLVCSSVHPSMSVRRSGTFYWK